MAEESKPPQLAIEDAIHLLQVFRGAELTRTIGQIEKSLKGASADSYAAALTTSGARAEVLGAAGLIKQLAGQINVVIHALGILLCLPRILRPGEIIDYVSLGAGNTGRAFDLETNHRIAEFKFIHWQGGPESIRHKTRCSRISTRWLSVKLRRRNTSMCSERSMGRSSLTGAGPC